MMFKRISAILLIIIGLISFCPVMGEGNEYIVKDNNSGLIEYFDKYASANTFYEENKDEYKNLILIVNSKVVKMEYGIVRFNNDEDYIDYYSLLREENDVICANYGVDGAYLYSSESGKNIYFKIAGDIGHTSIDNVFLIPYEELNAKVSMYHTDDTYLYHNVKSQLDYNYYANSLILDFIPEYLETNRDYYSYDGHYFYDNFYEMIDDYNSDTYEHAINDVAYYNYYQYLPYRSLTNYSYTELEDYFYNTLGINGNLVRYSDLNQDGATDEVNRSQLYGNVDEFFACQNIYGANALMLISEAINESSYGRSENAYLTNNLYNTSAFDTSEETENKRYSSVAKSIYNHAKYFVSNRYSNYLRDDYCGSFAGDKYAGITSAYSLDHYFGERLASTYFNIDIALGLKDYNTYSIGLIDSSTNIYNDGDLTDYRANVDNRLLSCIVLNDFDNSYLIQLDDSFNNDYIYSYEDSIGYINKDNLNLIIDNGDNNDEFVSITYDFNGGSYNGFDNITIRTKKGSVPAYLEPSLAGYEFIGYDTSLSIASDDITYTAKYKQIKSISLYNLIDKQDALCSGIDISGAYINVKYEDGTRNKIALTSDMLSFIDTNTLGKQDLTISYCGVSTNKNIYIDDDLSILSTKIDEAITNGDYEYVKDNIEDVSYYLPMSKIRKIDYDLTNNRNYVINDNTGEHNVSVSGLDLSLSDKTSFSLFKDTYYLEINDIKSASKNKIEELAKGYGFEAVDGINISFKFNFQKINLNGPAIVQLDIEDKQNDLVYSVYHVDDNGDIIKCKTSQSNNYVQFIIYEAGDYLVLSKDSINTYDIADSPEYLTVENMGFDYHKFNLNVLCITLLDLVCIIGIIIYYIVSKKKAREWKDYKKSLQRAAIVQEGKRKN